MKKYKTLLFDADGTLFDFERAEYEAVRKLSEKLNIRFTNEVHSVYSRINDALWKQFEKKEITREFLQTARFERFLSKMNIEADAVKVNSMYLDFLSEGSYLLPGVYELCRNLSDEYSMAIITNGITKSQTRRFNNSRLAEFFKYLFISETMGIQKPDKRYFDYVFKSMGIYDLSEVLVIGDSLSSDILGANNAGVDSCWFNPNNKPISLNANPTYTVSSLCQISDILK